MTTLRAPYPFFGGKSRIASLAWQRFGRVENFVEPFFGSGAMLLGRPVECGSNPSEAWPHCFGTETVNDRDGYISNFWRALLYAPDEVAAHADHPVNEIDLHSWHRTLVDTRERVERMLVDPKYYDAELAGRWVWGISQWIGTGWCPRDTLPAQQIPAINAGDRSSGGMGVHRVSLVQQVPMLAGDSGATGRGVHAGRLAQKRPAIGGRGHPGSVGGVHGTQLHRNRPGVGGKGDKGQGVHRVSLSRQMPEIGAAAGGNFDGRGVHRQTLAEGALYDYFRALATRLRRVRVVCGDFARILGPSVTWRHGMTAVFLDPPYADAEHAIQYSGGGNVWERVTAWCEANGDHPLLRIALCGYAGTWEPPAGWEAVQWRTPGGYGSQGNGRGRENAARECVWFSPACLDPAELARDALTRPLVVGDSDWTGTMFEEEL